MRIKTKISEPVGFRPITLKILFESKEEVQALYNRMNCAPVHVDNDSQLVPYNEDTDVFVSNRLHEWARKQLNNINNK